MIAIMLAIGIRIGINSPNNAVDSGPPPPQGGDGSLDFSNDENSHWIAWMM